MKRAIFLDRDGVLDELMYYADTQAWEAPRVPQDLRLRPGVRQALALAAANGWLIFVVSNQPDAAKGKTSYESLRAVHEELLRQLGGSPITEFFYCYHRTEDACACRKPQPFFLFQAAERYRVDLGESWFAGDVDTDIECGRRAGCRTALIEYPHSISKRGAQRPDLVCADLGQFVRLLTGLTSSDDTQPEN
jgi:D-glycero-D-manno-heptose 1,7-bisphosphate phosphatase